MEERADPVLLALARAGDKEAFGILIARYQAMALQLALRLTSNQEIARDLVQEAMLAAYLSLDHIRDATRFKSWFYGIVLNVCRSYLRERRLSTSSLDTLATELYEEREHMPGYAADPQEEVEERELHDVMRQAVGQLSERNRAVTLLFYYGQLSLREIAATLQISVVAAKSRLAQARKELRERLIARYPEMVQMTMQAEKRRNMIPVTIAEVVQHDPRSIAILLDVAGKRALPVWVGYWEGQAIASTLQNLPTPGPLSFTFTANLLQASGSELVEVRLDLLHEDTLYAITRVRHSTNGGEVEEVESRPSEALALAAQTGSVISVAEDVLTKLAMTVTPVQGKLAQAEIEMLIARMRQGQHQQSSSVFTTSDVSYYKPPRQPRNLNGEDGSAGWLMAGSHAQNYDFGIDNVGTRNGHNSLYIRSKLSEPGGFGSLLQMIAADDYRGKRIRFAGHVKIEDVAQQSTLCLYAYGPDSVLRQEFVRAGTMMGTQNWQAFEVVLDVPQESVRLAFGILLRGAGQVWINDVSFTATDQPATPVTRPTVPTDRPYNLDFAQGTSGWSLQEMLAYQYRQGIDHDVKHNTDGPGSLFLASNHPAAEGQTSLMQHILTTHYRGQRVRISGMLKCEGIAAWAGLWVVIYGTHGGMVFNSNVQQRDEQNLRLIGTHDWQQYEIVVDVIEESSRISFGLGLMGAGRVWLDDLKFEGVGKDVPTTTIQ